MEKITQKNVIEKWAKDFPCVMLWLSKIQHKDKKAHYLWLYCIDTKLTPEKLLALKEGLQSKKAEMLLDTFLMHTAYSNSQKYNISIVVKSFYKHNYCSLERAAGNVTFEKQTPYRKHTKDELLKIYRATFNPRDRALIPFTWSTAIAKESLTKLKWKNLDADWQKQEIPHIGLQDKIVKGHGIGKYKGVEQHTFLTPEAKRDLIEYKEWFERTNNVKLTEEDPIFINLESGSEKRALGYQGLSSIAEDLMKRSGIKFGWHDARRYVESALEEVKMHPNWARKIRGRKVRGEEAPYSRPAIEQLRKAYEEAVPLLQFTSPTDTDYLRRRQETSEQIMNKIVSGEPLTEEDRTNIKRFNIQLREIRHGTHDGGIINCEFEQIGETQLLSYLKAGWQIVHKLETGELIVKR